MKDAAETPEVGKDAPRGLKRDNENPWYILMTLYGNDHESNVCAWNAWATQNLSQECLDEIVGMSKWTVLQIPYLEHWVKVEEEVKEAFTKRFYALNGEDAELPQIPRPSHTIDFSQTEFTNVIDASDRLCCINRVRDSLFESSWVATMHEQLVPCEVQDQELAFVQHGAEAARFAINLV
jgi:hypothetical protein